MTNRINYKTRRAIVNAIINETKDHGDAIRPLNCERWDDITIDEYELPDDMFTALIPNDAKNGATGNVILPEDLVKAMRRGSKELQAKYNTTDMIDILYAEATK